MAALEQDNSSRYGFAKACAANDLCRVHTVDSVLAPPESATASTPTLPVALALLDAAGYDLIAVRTRKGVKITNRRRNVG
jgi:hypothetical protein